VSKTGKEKEGFARTVLLLPWNSNRQKRVAYSEWFQISVVQYSGILDVTWFPDEAWFHLSGYVKSQNTHLSVAATYKFAAIAPAMLAQTLANIEPLVGLCLQAEGNKFQHLL
jgi:hypothetical protein